MGADKRATRVVWVLGGSEACEGVATGTLSTPFQCAHVLKVPICVKRIEHGRRRWWAKF